MWVPRLISKAQLEELMITSPLPLLLMALTLLRVPRMLQRPWVPDVTTWTISLLSIHDKKPHHQFKKEPAAHGGLWALGSADLSILPLEQVWGLVLRTVLDNLTALGQVPDPFTEQLWGQEARGGSAAPVL